ncbi:MAG: imidazoleglycerol-phosphate dehydratase HisB [Deltaproteobacteria bacterium]|nr:imidazoleglycerol-phosphate dehydratase HisB [Deltaproteobacteria bacterium]MBN2673782.1 imidazoleglycerol-phosphate dehydratase HisB [Deltaproteobacteria bacterium]
MSDRIATIKRKTLETDILLELNLDGTGVAEILTGVGFFDHMLTSLSKHSKIDISLRCNGDLDVDDHHTVEDCAIALGQAFDKAVGDKRGIVRFGHAYAPLDEALARAVVDLSGRPNAHISLLLDDGMIGNLKIENLAHAFESFAMHAKITLHVDVLRGLNSHHKAEAAFKALALALRAAVMKSDSNDAVPSTKGVL